MLRHRSMRNIITGAISPYVIQGGNDDTQQYIILGCAHVTSAALLGTLTLTYAWTEASAARTHVETLLLTVLGNNKDWTFIVSLDPNTDMSFGCSLTGLTGSFSAECGSFTTATA